jgi:hypothetical protein
VATCGHAPTPSAPAGNAARPVPIGTGTYGCAVREIHWRAPDRAVIRVTGSLRSMAEFTPTGASTVYYETVTKASFQWVREHTLPARTCRVAMMP